MSAGEEALRIVSREADGTVELSNGSVLAARELEVLRLMSRGRSNREIADELFLSVHTIEYHATRIYEKLSVTNRTQAARVAADIGLLRDGPPEGETVSLANDTAYPEPSPGPEASAGLKRWAVGLALGALFAAFLTAILVASPGFAVSGSSSPQYCFGQALATPQAPGPLPPDAAAREVETVCFKTQEDAAAYSRELGLRYCVTDADKPGAAGEASPLCFDTPAAARDFARQLGLQ